MSKAPSDDQSGETARALVTSWMIAVLLAFCYTIAYLDRQIISLLIEPIQRDLHISDTQFGLLQGISFSLFYVAATLPLAWLADRTRRSRVMSGCVAAWSVMTMLSGAATSFALMMASRIGVAAAESGLTPAALATLSDRFNRHQLATATAMYMLAPFVGGGFALGLGGAIYAWAQTLEPGALPFLDGFAAWQIVFFIVGLLGIIPSMLLLLIRDRRQPRDEAVAKPAVNEVLALFGKHWRIFWLYQLAMALVMVLLASYVTWLPAAIMRSKGIGEAEVGTLFGPVYLLCGAAGTLSAGLIVTRMAPKDPTRTVIRYQIGALLLLWPLAVFGLMSASLYAEFAMIGGALFLTSSVTSLSSLTFQYITPRRLRAQSLAIMAMVTALVGTGAGPVLAGFLSDHLSAFAHPLSAALAIIGMVTVPAAALLMAIALRSHGIHRLDRSAIEQETA
ncbi:MAG: MFS transporter [Novosphingobium sp.]